MGKKKQAHPRRSGGLIARGHDQEPGAKVLVFSSWNDVLDVLEHAFDANGVTDTRMKGGRTDRKSHAAISLFRGDQTSPKSNSKTQGKHVQVLLPLVQHGANGLNLLEARHVILVEPLLNPAAEASNQQSTQHQPGKRDLVHRFVLKDSVEESIYKLHKSRNSSSSISGNTKNQDQPVLTLKDIELLFAAAPATKPDTHDKAGESMMHLPPSMAAAIAAERRLKEQSPSTS